MWMHGRDCTCDATERVRDHQLKNCGVSLWEAKNALRHGGVQSSRAMKAAIELSLPEQNLEWKVGCGNRSLDSDPGGATRSG